MNPAETGDRYNRIAQWWQTRHQDSIYGLEALARAIRYAPSRQRHPAIAFYQEDACSWR
jgi:hypothetical protein